LENQIFCRYGPPKTIISDNGKHFDNRQLKRLCDEWGVEHVTTSAYHPSANRAERTNQELVRMISSYLEGGHGRWDENVQKFALVLRSMKNDGTKVSPALLNYGREIPLPVDRALQAESNFDSQKLASQLPSQLKDLISFVRNNIFRAHDQSKQYYDAGRREVSFEVGEKVWVRNHELSDGDAHRAQKFMPKFIGPFTIKKKFGDTYYLDVDGRLLPKRHVSELKAFHSREDFHESQNPSQSSVNGHSRPQFHDNSSQNFYRSSSQVPQSFSSNRSFSRSRNRVVFNDESFTPNPSFQSSNNFPSRNLRNRPRINYAEVQRGKKISPRNP